jgi:hypothetical protein
MTTNKRRMYGMIYRSRKKGSYIVTRQRVICKPYTNEAPTLSRQEQVLMSEYSFCIQLQIK